MKNRHLLILGIVVMVFITACGDNTEQSTGNKQTVVSRFEIDNDTIKQKDESLLISLNEQQEIKEKNEENEEKNTNSYNINEHIGEITITNNTENKPVDTNSTDNTEEHSEGDDSTDENESTEQNIDEEQTDTPTNESDNVSEVENTPDINLSYVVSNNDVIYNDVTYTDLYTNIKEIEGNSQYDEDTLIKFILQSYPSSEQVYTFINIDTDDAIEEEGDDNTNRTIDELLLTESNMYNSIRSKYNDKATWMLTINKWMGKDKAMLAGCKSFTIIIGTDEDIEVDVSDFE